MEQKDIPCGGSANLHCQGGCIRSVDFVLHYSIKLNIHIYIVPKFSIHKALYSCDMEAARSEAAQTETLKKLCAKDKCDIDPRAIFDTSSCPGMQL